MLLTGLLYGGVPGGASEGPPTGAAAAAASEAALEVDVALLLPTGSEAFARAAESVRAGFLEAARKQPPPVSVRLYPVTDDPQSVIDAYRKAVIAGARLVVGPLTRSGVTALAANADVITVPTLALNVPEGIAQYPGGLYSLSLQIEAEAHQVAQLALREGRRKALTVTGQTPLGRRMRDAFVDAFQQGGGAHVADYAYPTDNAGFEQLRQASGSVSADMVFLALDATRGRLARPYLSGMPAYGTSQLNPGAKGLTGADLNDVRFVDMPWMLQPDHSAVMTYAREGARQPEDLERLYALGIDAYRVAHELLAGNRNFELDGVTGRLTLGLEGQVKRGLLVVLITGGQLTILGETEP